MSGPMAIRFDDASVFSGRIHAERSGPERTPTLFMHHPDRPGYHMVRWLSENEVAQLAEQFCGMLAAGPAAGAVAATSAARIRERDLSAAREARATT